MMIPSQTARALQISERTLGKWEKSGKIKAERSAGNWRLYHESDVEKLKREMHAKARRGAK